MSGCAAIMPRMGTKPSTGIATYFGILATLAGAVGTVYAAVKSNDTATVTAGVGTISTSLATLGGRYGQAIVLARRYAPLVGAAARGVSGETGGTEDDVAARELGDVLDGAPDIATHPPDAVGADEGDPLTRGEVVA